MDEHAGTAAPIRQTIDASCLPEPSETLWPSYGAAHVRPTLAIAPTVGSFEVDLTTFKVGMPVLCNYIVKGRSNGWYTGIIHSINGNTANIDYDDGDYDYDVHFKNLRHIGHPRRYKFEVKTPPAPRAIVLSIPHAHEAVAEAMRLIRAIEEEHGYTSDAAVTSRPPLVYATPEEVVSDDEVEIVFERCGTTRGTADRPIVL